MVDQNAWKAAYESAEKADTKTILKRLLSFIKNPLNFFETDRSPHPDLIASGSLLIRINATLFFLVRAIAIMLHPDEAFPNIEVVLGVLLGIYAFVLILSKYISGFLVFLLPRAYNFFVKFVTDRDNLLAAERIIVYSSTALILWIIPFGLLLSLVLFVILLFIGTIKQYGAEPVRALLAALFPSIIIFILLFVLGVVSI